MFRSWELELASAPLQRSSSGAQAELLIKKNSLSPHTHALVSLVCGFRYVYAAIAKLHTHALVSLQCAVSAIQPEETSPCVCGNSDFFSWKAPLERSWSDSALSSIFFKSSSRGAELERSWRGAGAELTRSWSGADAELEPAPVPNSETLLSASAHKGGICWVLSSVAIWPLKSSVFLQVFIQSSISTDSPYCELLDYFFSESKSELYCLNVDRNSITMTCRGSTTYPNDSEVLPPSRKAKWPADREHFWTNWRVSTKKTIKTMYAECKICSDGKFYIGNMGSFSNFSRHVARKHERVRNRDAEYFDFFMYSHSCSFAHLSTPNPLLIHSSNRYIAKIDT